MKKSVKISIISLACIASASTIAPTAVVLSNTLKKTNNHYTASNDKLEPILSINQKIDLFANENIISFKTYWIEYFNYSVDSIRFSFLKNEMQLLEEVNSTLDLIFEKIIESSNFFELENYNDEKIIKKEFKEICNKYIEYFSSEFSELTGWSYNFVNLLFNKSISNNKYIELNKRYMELISEEYYTSLYNNSLNEIDKNEKFMWLLQQTNTLDSDIEHVIHDHSIKSAKENYEIRSEIQDYIIWSNHIDTNYNDQSSRIYESKINVNFIVDFLEDARNIINNNIENNNHTVNNKQILYDELKCLKDKIINSSTNESNKKIIKMIWFFISSNWNNLYNSVITEKTANKINALIYTISNVIIENEYEINEIIRLFPIEQLTLIINELQEFINLGKNTVNSYISLARQIVRILTGNQLNTVKQLLVSFYKLNLERMWNYFTNIIDNVCNSLNTFGYDTIQLINFKNSISSLINSLYEIVDFIWSITGIGSLVPGVNVILSILLSLFLNGPDYDGNILNDLPGTNTIENSIALLFGISNIITSPFEGLIELIDFCNDNNISFYQWTRAHYECIKQFWILALDPLNVFHSCIRNLVKFI